VYVLSYTLQRKHLCCLGLHFGGLTGLQKSLLTVSLVFVIVMIFINSVNALIVLEAGSFSLPSVPVTCMPVD